MFKAVPAVLLVDHAVLSGKVACVVDTDSAACVSLTGKPYYVTTGMVLAVTVIVVVTLGMSANEVVGGGVCDVACPGYFLGIPCAGVVVEWCDG